MLSQQSPAAKGRGAPEVIRVVIAVMGRYCIVVVNSEFRKEQLVMVAIIKVNLKRVKLLPEKIKKPHRYQFKDLESKLRKSTRKTHTEFRRTMNIGDHAIMLAITYADYSQKYIIINDLQYAYNFYNWIMKHHSNVAVEYNWYGQLKRL